MLELTLLVVGALVALAIYSALRRPWRSRRSVEPPMAPPPPYPGYGRAHGYGPAQYGGRYDYGQGRGYEPRRRSGMSPGAAGALGAVGGGLIGYELGQMHGGEQQLAQDEMMNVMHDEPGQGDWFGGQQVDFDGFGGGDPGLEGFGGDW
jgi:hypothetical protein